MQVWCDEQRYGSRRSRYRAVMFWASGEIIGKFAQMRYPQLLTQMVKVLLKRETLILIRFPGKIGYNPGAVR
jgi:hypothetical protein